MPFLTISQRLEITWNPDKLDIACSVTFFQNTWNPEKFDIACSVMFFQNKGILKTKPQTFTTQSPGQIRPLSLRIYHIPRIFYHILLFFGQDIKLMVLEKIFLLKIIFAVQQKVCGRKVQAEGIGIHIAGIRGRWGCTLWI